MPLGAPCCRLSGATSPEKGSGVVCACLVEANLLFRWLNTATECSVLGWLGRIHRLVCNGCIQWRKAAGTQVLRLVDTAVGRLQHSLGNTITMLVQIVLILRWKRQRIWMWSTLPYCFELSSITLKLGQRLYVVCAINVLFSVTVQHCRCTRYDKCKHCWFPLARAKISSKQASCARIEFRTCPSALS